MSITIKSKSETEKMREACQIVAKTHLELASMLEVGVSTHTLDSFAKKYITSFGAVPSFLNYHGYPASVCISINDEVVHGIPSKKRKIMDGDVVSIDIGAFYKGFHGDAARSYVIGNGSEEAKKIVEVTEASFYEGMKYAGPGYRLYEISRAIQQYVESNGCSVVRDLVGHGIGKALHEDPQIPNYKPPYGRGPRLQPGMTLAIEPMVNGGRYDVRTLDDNWTVVTLDGKLSAHYENTVLITDSGYELLTVID